MTVRAHLHSTPLLLAIVCPAALAQQYGPQVVLQQIPGPRGFVAFDADHDGDRDVFCLSTSFSGVRSVENLGGGNFGTPTTLTGTMIGVQSIALADIDGDGETDILGTSGSDGLISWFPSNGDGTFAPVERIGPVLPNLRDGVAEDLDQDGDLDVVVVDFFGNVVVLESLGGGTFAAEQTVATGLGQLSSVEITDLDGDTNPDLLVASTSTDRVLWLRNLGSLAFGSASSITTGADGVEDAHAVDLDGDGVVDVLVASAMNDQINWFRGQGGGSFANATLIDGAADGVSQARAFDLDFDGDLDIIAAVEDANEVRVYDNVGFGFFGPGTSLNSPGTMAAIRVNGVMAGDFDDDLDVDILSISQGDSKLAMYERVEELGTVYCSSAANSTGSEGRLSATGARDVSYNRVVLAATELPPSVFGFFVTSQTAGMVVGPGGSQGTLCLGGGIGRYSLPSEIMFTGATRSMRMRLDLTATPTPAARVPVMAGETWRFQGWHRDTVSGAATSNFTEAVAVTFD